MSDPRTGSCRIGIGAFLCILVVGAASGLCHGHPGDASLLIAPIGASAFILLAAPASAAGRRYAVLMGNLVAAIAGLAAPHLLPVPLLAAAAALGVATAAMALLRCSHPPAGGVALIAALAGAQPLAAGLRFLLENVLLNALLLIGAAAAFNLAADAVARRRGKADDARGPDARPARRSAEIRSD